MGVPPVGVSVGLSGCPALVVLFLLDLERLFRVGMIVVQLSFFEVPRQRMYWRYRNLPFKKSMVCQARLRGSSSFCFSVGGVSFSSERRAIKANAAATMADTAMTMIRIGHTIVVSSYRSTLNDAFYFLGEPA